MKGSPRLIPSSWDLNAGPIREWGTWSAIIPIGRPLEEQLQSQKYMSQRPRPRLFLTKLNLDRNLPDLIFDDPDGRFPSVRTGKTHFNQRGTQLMWELDGRILSFYELEDLAKAVEKGNHRVVESPIVEDSSEVEVA